MNFNNKYVKDINNFSNKKKDIWNALRKSNKYPEEEFLHLWKIEYPNFKKISNLNKLQN
jgi:hypothetical protein